MKKIAANIFLFLAAFLISASIVNASLYWYVPYETFDKKGTKITTEAEKEKDFKQIYLVRNKETFPPMEIELSAKVKRGPIWLKIGEKTPTTVDAGLGHEGIQRGTGYTLNVNGTVRFFWEQKSDGKMTAFLYN